jgi:hypothetical protein
MFESSNFPLNVLCENIMEYGYIPWGSELAKRVAQGFM